MKTKLLKNGFIVTAFIVAFIAAPLEYAFNPKFLVDALEHLDGDEIMMGYPGTYGAVIIDETGYSCVIMPIRDAVSPIEEAAKKKKRG